MDILYTILIEDKYYSFFFHILLGGPWKTLETTNLPISPNEYNMKCNPYPLFSKGKSWFRKFFNKRHEEIRVVTRTD